MEEVSKKLRSKGILDDEGEASCCWKKILLFNEDNIVRTMNVIKRGIITEKAFLARSES